MEGGRELRQRKKEGVMQGIIFSICFPHLSGQHLDGFDYFYFAHCVNALHFCSTFYLQAS